MSDRAPANFQSPFEVETPEGAEGWQRLYPYYACFSEDRRAFEDEKFWFHDSMHYPEPMYPFDLLMPENTWLILNQNTTKVFVVPTALGLDHRVVNGYVYVSPTMITDPDEIARRAAYFNPRAGHYFENWDEIYENWVAKANDCRQRLTRITFEPLPDVEPDEVVTQARELTSGFHLARSYNELLENVQEMAYLHFEMLGLGYGAYMTFRELCQRAFPGISDQNVAKMVAGIDILMFRPDDELRKLARLGVELGLVDQLARGDTPEAVLSAVAQAPRGDEWIAALETAKEPWFWFSTGAGLTHGDRAWIDDLRTPFGALKTYVEKLVRGDEIDRPLEGVQAERDRITSEYRALLGSDDDRAAFDGLVALARTVYPFVENHNFYAEHQHYSLFWNKVRELGAVFAAHGFLDDKEDVFLLQRHEVHPALADLITGWATETPDRRAYWQREVADRKRIMEALRRWSPPPALGKVPDSITEPFTVMLWGITEETVDRWRNAGGDDSGVLQGIGAAPGVAEGPARVIFSAAELEDVEDGEILVCPITAPSWAPVFSRIKAAVSDIGGIMAHAAIVSREYGLPAVVGTGFGTKRIRTGQRLRVDGAAGTVEILEDDTGA
ncbi:PEP-utilizing enzyme [Gaiella occulta]|uniref:PEP-utilizing enzyme n=1 Tax=Gaiella occulta TaxID=1002870 RepID=A0A7M2YX83_9ACTN|nr:PEP-utilizing enzyme [Gaiella occulta]RDI74743.1 PEP-utilizing enzyme [Gaiella occulta]